MHDRLSGAEPASPMPWDGAVAVAEAPAVTPAPDVRQRWWRRTILRLRQCARFIYALLTEN
jgi:hypothetical protein